MSEQHTRSINEPHVEPIGVLHAQDIIPAELESLAARAERASVAFPEFAIAPELSAVPSPTDDTLNRWSLARRARDKLRKSPPENPTPEEWNALEFAIRSTRAAPQTRGGTIGDLPGHVGRVFPQWSSFKVKFQPRLRAIGRIDFPPGSIQGGAARQDYGGTGFLVGPRHLLTCSHVIAAMNISLRHFSRGQAVIYFQDEIPGTPGVQDMGTLERVLAADDVTGNDLVLFEVKLDTVHTPLPLASAPLGSNEPIVAIGYPANSGTNPEKYLTKKLMEGPLGVRRTAPGEVIPPGKMMGKVKAGTVHHDCTTLRGNSGSPLVSMSTGKVVGVHQDGEFMGHNWGVDATIVRTFLARAGINV